MIKKSDWDLTIDPTKLKSIQIKLMQLGIRLVDVRDYNTTITIFVDVTELQPLLAIEGVLEANYVKKDRKG